ncbi:Uncharacterised protein [Mycobacteroides abscessus subsp. abscessus]|nr:Uncharacterised protein [Mycobacteroides abscessus subsp. abscessus]SKU03725.1 Uncharacterised protein [Mycobacteroides abscessus subsp. abscessus]
MTSLNTQRAFGKMLSPGWARSRTFRRVCEDWRRPAVSIWRSGWTDTGWMP